MCAIDRVVGVIKPGIPGINRTDCCASKGGITGGPYAVHHKGMIGSINGDTDRIVVRNCILAKVGSKIIGSCRATGPINPIVEPVRLGTGARVCIVPCAVGNGMWIGTEIAANILTNVADPTSPATVACIESTVNSLLRVVPLRTLAIVIEPVVDLDRSDVGYSAPVAVMLIPVIIGRIHPTMVGAVKRIARRAIG